jgi:UDP-N-acetylglucosamine 2-epimerase (hydrolysing)
MSDARKKILFITGTRADYGKLRPLLEQVERAPQFECQIFATGMHTLSRYGSTFDEIRKSGFRNIFLYMNQFAVGSTMDMVLASTIQGLAHYVREFAPDMIVVHGDRIEAMAGALVGSLNNVLVAHIEGGELSGTVDELIRHAVSKLSHVHFVANDEARGRIIQMGERESSVFVIGSADIDVMLYDTLPSLDEAKGHYDIAFNDYAILAYHPVTTELDHLRVHIRTVRDALVASRMNFIVVYPNNDAGADIILEELQALHESPRFRMFPSLRFEYFLALLRGAQAMVGNSSAGIREAPVYGVPTVNIGTRQLNRFDYPSIVNVPEEHDAIVKALLDLPRGFPPSLHFGEGRCAAKFIRVLSSPAVWRTPRQKQFRDLPAAERAARTPASVVGGRA